MKYVAFGIGYLDRKGTIIEESENFFIVKTEGYGLYPLALSKNPNLTKVFDSEEERNEWIKDQRYEYDSR